MESKMVTIPLDDLLLHIRQAVKLELANLADKEKSILTVEEAAKYLNISRGTLYKLTSANAVPFSKPTGKQLYFDKEKLDAWILSNSTTSAKEKDVRASTYITTHQ